MMDGNNELTSPIEGERRMWGMTKDCREQTQHAAVNAQHAKSANSRNLIQRQPHETYLPHTEHTMQESPKKVRDDDQIMRGRAFICQVTTLVRGMSEKSEKCTLSRGIDDWSRTLRMCACVPVSGEKSFSIVSSNGDGQRKVGSVDLWRMWMKDGSSSSPEPWDFLLCLGEVGRQDV